MRRPGEYQLHAAITALQIQAPDADATDWVERAELERRAGRAALIEFLGAVQIALPAATSF
jgi:predicted RNA polymerase sigma factor